MANAVMDYDPNLTCSGRMAKQTVRLTFGMWHYRQVIEVEVGGNCTGLTVIDCAVGNAYDTLEQHAIYGSDETYAVIDMPDPSNPEEVLECADDDMQRREEWLKDMLIAAEIVAIRPDVKEESHNG
ncbi:DUF5406 domain-containing protein [Pseudomonas balearica]|uniref:DUF5406 family protein n=1 Tax=Stutzerimonas balearica TaxID=74829 RepID=UPI001F3BE546|nr:DUF5406 family protein [Stutzerimonas balearica]MCF6758284.1 DUF5406 domain-containing protein [Stutzerimonas balearica]